MSISGEQPAPARRFGWAAALLAFAVVLAYQGSLRAPFLFDDAPAIQRNTSIRQLWPLTSVLSPPTTAAGAAGRPVVNLTLALDYAAYGLDPRGYHATNLLLHLLTGLALCTLLRRTLARLPRLAPVTDRTATAATVLWLVHPLTSESVVCIVQRNEILAALFLLLTLLAFAGGHRVTAFVCCLAGMASKEVMVVAPLIVWLYDRTFISGSWREAWRRHGRLHLSLAATWALLAWLLLQNQQRAGTVGFGLGMSAWDYLLTQCRALVTYLKLTIWPHPLVLDYGFDAVHGVGDIWLEGIVVLALLAGTVVALVRKPALGFVGACFFLWLAPSSSFVPLTTQTIAEHRMYLPLAAPVILLVCALARWPRAHFVAWGLAAAAAIVTIARVDDYRTEESIWRDTIGKVPQNARAHASLAGVYAREQHWPEAAQAFATALRLRPDYADAQNDYGNVLLQLQRVDEAIEHYSAARRLKPADSVIRYNLAAALTRAGRFAAAVEVDPDNAEYQNNFADELVRAGKAQDAAAHYTAAIRLKPDVPELHYNLGNVWLQLNRFDDAVQEYGRALAGRPDWALAHHNLALALVRAGRPVEALPHYETVVRQMPESAPVRHNYALALAAAGRNADAIAQLEAALRVQPDYAEARQMLVRLRGR